MAGIKVRPCDRPPPGWASPPHPPKPQFDFGRFRSSLSSMKETSAHYGSWAFQFLSQIFLALKTALKTEKKAPPSPERARSRKKLHLKKSSQFLQAFSRDPAKVIGKLLDLLSRKPETAREILLNLTRHWKVHPEAFPRYDATPGSRNITRSELVELFLVFTLPANCQRFREKILEGNLTEREVLAMQGRLTDPDDSETKFLEEYSALQTPEGRGSPALWDAVLAYLEGNQSLRDLVFDEGEEKSFARVVEEMVFQHHWISLYSSKVNAKFLNLVRGICVHLLEATTGKKEPLLDQYPTVKPLIEQAVEVLGQKERVRDIIIEVLRETCPLTKSPPRRT